MLTCCRYIGRLAILSSLRCLKSATSLGRILSRVVAAQKLQYPLRDPALRVAGGEGWGRGQRVAGEEALVQHLAAAEGAPRHVPGEAEELHPLLRLDAVGGEILLDLRLQRPG